VACKLTLHHLFFPKSDYSTPLEKEFRSLPENITLVCRGLHDKLDEKPPPKPSVTKMRQAVDLNNALKRRKPYAGLRSKP
jgi:hypothetical protein